MALACMAAIGEDKILDDVAPDRSSKGNLELYRAES